MSNLWICDIHQTANEFPFGMSFRCAECRFDDLILTSTNFKEEVADDYDRQQLIINSQKLAYENSSSCGNCGKRKPGGIIYLNEKGTCEKCGKTI